ncbi:MAG TPA: hypothetical protein VFS20_08275 [Longimicrobium sp.]|nr:hypothetical protein [Longimicrobium sp.]
MRKPVYLLAALALLAAAGCSRSDGIVAPERNATTPANNTSTTSTTTNSTPPNTSPAQDTTSRGGGFLGSGG